MFLPSYVMRTHGAKQQRQAVKRAPMNQLEPAFEVRALCFVLSVPDLYLCFGVMLSSLSTCHVWKALKASFFAHMFATCEDLTTWLLVVYTNAVIVL